MGYLGQQNSVSVGTSSTFLLTANPRRRRLTVSAPPTNRITLSFGVPAVLDAGWNVDPNTAGRTITEDDVGELLQRDIFAISAVGAQTVGFTEVMDY